MEKSELRDTLAKVQAELTSAKSVDDETRRMLTELTDDIERLSEQSEEESAEQVESLGEQVQDMMLQFETEHPRLTNALNQVAAALANLGI